MVKLQETGHSQLRSFEVQRGAAAFGYMGALVNWRITAELNPGYLKLVVAGTGAVALTLAVLNTIKAGEAKRDMVAMAMPETSTNDEVAVE